MRNCILNKKFKYTYRNACLYLAAINCVVYFITTVLKPNINGVPLLAWMSLIPGFVHEGYVWQLVTYMFVHGGITHLFFNMYELIIFGSYCERELGTREFLLFYFVTGILSGVLSYFSCYFWGGWFVPIVGASGAIMAVFFLVSVLFPQNRVLLFWFLPLKMPVAMLFLLVSEMFFQLTGTQADVAHLIHLGGIFIAWLYCKIRLKISPVRAWKNAM